MKEQSPLLLLLLLGLTQLRYLSAKLSSEIAHGSDAHIYIDDDYPDYVVKQLYASDKNSAKCRQQPSVCINPKDQEELTREKEVLEFLAAKKYPVPAVKSLVNINGGPALVMEHIKGKNLKQLFTENIENRTFTKSLAHVLAQLHAKLHSISGAPLQWRDTIPKDFSLYDGTKSSSSSSPSSTTINEIDHSNSYPIHLDFWPQNVILKNEEELSSAVVIDWNSVISGTRTETMIQTAYTAVSILLQPATLFFFWSLSPDEIERLDSLARLKGRNTSVADSRAASHHYARTKAEAFVLDFIQGFPPPVAKDVLSHVSEACRLARYLWSHHNISLHKISRHRLKQMEDSNSLFPRKSANSIPTTRAEIQET